MFPVVIDLLNNII